MSLPQTLIIKKWRIVMTFENRHRAEVWSDLVFADPQVGLDLRQYAEGKAFNNTLLHGPYGAAKSMTAKVLAATSYGKRLSEVVLDISEIQHDVDSRLQALFLLLIPKIGNIRRREKPYQRHRGILEPSEATHAPLQRNTKSPLPSYGGKTISLFSFLLRS